MTRSAPKRGKLLSVLGLECPTGDLRVSDLAVDSRSVTKGSLFAGLPGVNWHGASFAGYAERMGAAAILTDEAGLEGLGKLDPSPQIPVIFAEDARLALAIAAARFFDAQPEVLAAVTGTNGKTSVASFTRQIWENAGAQAVNFGTTGVEGAVSAPLAMTTPEPVELHGLLADLAAEGVTHAAMEASSHGLAQRRLDGVHLTAAAFTNITRDHLDYHTDFKDYFNAKMGLFSRVLGEGRIAVINTDDAAAGDLIQIANARGQTIIRVGAAETADLRLNGQRFDTTGQDVRFTWANEAWTTRLELIGGFQASNVLVAAGLAIGCGLAAEDVFGALSEIRTVRGRMELAARRSNGAAVFVDYAHTPDALKTALSNLRPHVLGRLLVVFGAGGDRDPGKRALMGAAAAEAADVAWITDDNPRSEDPASIRAAIAEGCPEATIIGDRATAILSGVDALQPGDALLIAGKGHESGQIIGTDVYPFDDAEQASIAVAALDGMEA